MADITALTAQVTQSTTVEQSAIALIQGIAAELAGLQPTQAAIDALTTQLNASATALAAFDGHSVISSSSRTSSSNVADTISC